MLVRRFVSTPCRSHAALAGVGRTLFFSSASAFPAVPSITFREASASPASTSSSSSQFSSKNDAKGGGRFLRVEIVETSGLEYLVYFVATLFMLKVLSWLLGPDSIAARVFGWFASFINGCVVFFGFFFGF